MNPKIRWLLFFFFVVGFIIGAPLLVLYTAGYRYNWQSGTIIRTGVLSVSTSPRNLQISLDGVDINRETPAVIEQLMPGTYNISLSKDGYHTWQNKITIKSNITTHLPLITLWRDEDSTAVWHRITKQLTNSPDGNFVAYFVEQGGWSELWLYDLVSTKEKMIARIPDDADDMVISWSANGNFLLLNNENFATVSVYDQFGDSIELPITGPSVTDVFWHPSLNNKLYIRGESQLTEIDLQTTATLDLTSKGSMGVILDSGFISLVDTDTQTELRQTIGDKTKVIALLPRGEYSIIKHDNEYLVLQSAQDELLIINLNANEPILFKEKIKLYDYLTSSHLLLWSDGNEINIYNTSNHQTEFVTRQGSPITKLQFSPDGNYIFVAIENKLFAIDRYKNGEQRYTATLLETDRLNNFWIDSDGKTAYIDGTINTEIGLYSLQLK